MNLEDKDRNESDLIVWPSANRTKLVRESHASSDWIKWNSKRDELTSDNDIEYRYQKENNPTTRHADIHKTAVEHKANDYLQDNAMKNIAE